MPGRTHQIELCRSDFELLTNAFVLPSSDTSRGLTQGCDLWLPAHCNLRRRSHWYNTLLWATSATPTASKTATRCLWTSVSNSELDGVDGESCPTLPACPRRAPSRPIVVDLLRLPVCPRRRRRARFWSRVQRSRCVIVGVVQGSLIGGRVRPELSTVPAEPT